MRNLTGTTIQQYQILLKIRETGTRVLYKAYDSKTFHTVAVDVVKVGVKETQKLYELLVKQSKTNSELTHPNIPIAIDSGIYDGLIFFVYNFAPLYPLRRLFNKTYTWPEMARELVPVAKSLAVAHEHGVFHGFLNPVSVVLDEQKTPVLFDFGFEQIIANYALSQFPGAWMNSWGYAYASPEQLKGSPVDCRSDVYAMGMILHEWLTGKTAFHEETPFATLQMRAVSSTEALVLDKEIALPVQALIRKCLAVDPEERYQTLQEVSILLSHGALELPVTNKLVDNPFLQVEVKRPTRRWAFGLAAIVLFAAIGALWMFGDRLLPLTPGPATPTRTAALLAPAQPAATATIEEQEEPQGGPDVTATPRPIEVNFPVFQDTRLPANIDVLNVDSAEGIFTVAMWGIGDITRLTVSPGGKHMAVGTSIGIFVYDPTGFELQKHIVTSSWITALEFSSDGRLLAAGDVDGLIRLWDTETWEQVAALSGHRAEVLDVTFSTGGTWLASVAKDDTLFRWDLNAGNDVAPASVSVFRVSNVVLLGDGKWIATGGDDFKVNLWNVNDLSLYKTFTTSSKVVDLAALPFSNILAVGGSDRQLLLIDVESTEPPERVSGLQFPLSSVTVSPDGKLVAVGDINGGIIVWDRNGILAWKVSTLAGVVQGENFQGQAQSLAFSSDGKTLFSATRNGILRTLDALSGSELIRDPSFDVHAEKITVSPDSKYVITENRDGTIKVWDLHKGSYLYEKKGSLMEGSPFSPDSLMFAIAVDSSTVNVYQLSDGRDVYTLNGHRGIKAIRFVNNGTMLAAGQEQNMHVWSMASGQEIQTKREFSGNGCTTINSLKETRFLLITKYDHIIDLEEDSRICSLQKPDWMKTFFIDDTTSRVAYGGSSNLSVTGLAGADPLVMEGVNRQNVISVALHPNGRLLAAAFDDHTIHIWDISTQKELMRLFGHTNQITDLRFTPDGTLLVSTSLDGTIRLWGIPD